MKKRSVLHKQTVKKRRQEKKKSVFPVFKTIRRFGPAFLKCTLFFFIIAGTSLALMYGYHCLLTSACIRLEKVEVKGVGREVRDDLIDRCSLNSNPNLLALNLNDLKRRMEEHPWIRSVNLERQFPHTLVVHVEKNIPLAIVVLDEIYLMNQHCEIFKQINDSDEVDFPVITGVCGRGQKAHWQLQRAAQAIRILGSQKKPWSSEGLSEIHVNDEGLSLYFKHLAAAINVIGDDLEYKMRGLKKVTRHLRKKGRIHQVTGIDLNSVDGAVVSFRKS
jgi:cell division protein FtsQ